METKNSINVEVAYALADKQTIIPLTVSAECTAFQAAQLSGIAHAFPEIDLNAAKMGIFSKLVDDPKAHVLNAGDRVEIYRPLLIDPKEARAERAAKAKAASKK